MKLSPRIKSLKAILAHKRFYTGEYFSSNKNYPCCAMGYAYKTNGYDTDSKVNELNKDYAEIDKAIGLNSIERGTIMAFSDNNEVKKLHEYCQKLLDKELNAHSS